jgi:hypothetical protein
MDTRFQGTDRAQAARTHDRLCAMRYNYTATMLGTDLAKYGYARNGGQ